MQVDIFSFFAGLGLLDLGFEQAGFNIAFVDEFNPLFLQAYQYARKNSYHMPVYGYSNKSVSDFLDDAVWNFYFPDYHTKKDRIIGFVGGPPCPDFSAAGKNAGSDGKNGQLTNIYVNLIIKRKPDFFVLENVKGLFQTKKHKEFYELIKKRLYRAGYSLFDSIENALEYGTPQNRDRLVLIGFKRGFFGRRIHYQFGKSKQYDLNNILQLNWPKQNTFGENSFNTIPPGLVPELTVEYWFKKNDVLNHPNALDKFSVKNTERFYTIAEGDTSRKSFKRLHRWRFSPTAAYGNNEVHLHPYYPRRISVSEALAIQSLPTAFDILPDLSLSTKFKMVGNGVPYLLARGIATDLHTWLSDFFNTIGEKYD